MVMVRSANGRSSSDARIGYRTEARRVSEGQGGGEPM